MIVLCIKKIAVNTGIAISILALPLLTMYAYADDVKVTPEQQPEEQSAMMPETVDAETVGDKEDVFVADNETPEAAVQESDAPSSDAEKSVVSEKGVQELQETSIEKTVVESDAEDAEVSCDLNEQAGDDSAALADSCSTDTGDGDTASDKPKALYVLDLISAQRRAVADNPSIGAGAERIEQVRQIISQARSMYFPQINMSYTYTLSWLPTSYTDGINSYLDQTEDVLRDWRKESILQSTITRQPSLQERRDMRRWYNSTMDLIDDYREETENPVDNTTVNITAGWLLFDGFAREFINAMARYGHKEAQAAFREGQRILLDAVAQAYYGAQISREQIEIAKSDIAFYERLHKEAIARREVGRGATSHVLSFETLLYASRAGLLQAERNYKMARVILGMLMGMPEGRLDDRFELAVLEEETPETMTLPDEDAMVDLALSYRPDLEQREYGLKRAKASVKQQYASFAPTIALVGQMQTANVTESGFSSDRITSTVGLNASLNLFSGGRRRASVIEAKHARREAELRILEAEQKVMSDVYQAMEDLTVAQDALKLQREAADCVKKNRDLVELEYNAGKAMLVSLSQAQRDYMQAAGMLAQARVNLQRTWQALHAATGTNLIILDEKRSECDEEEVTSECCEENKVEVDNTELTDQDPK